jgi:hypothetical protein
MLVQDVEADADAIGTTQVSALNIAHTVPHVCLRSSRANPNEYITEKTIL